MLDSNLYVLHVGRLSHPNRADALTVEICGEGLVFIDRQDYLFA
jgi:hypothetical protein